MKAIRFHEYGGPEVLRYEEIPRPEPAQGEVLVRVHAVSVNPVDWKIRAGHLKSFREYPLPFIPGWDFSGVIESLGPGVSAWKPGDEVFGHPSIAGPGTYAEFITVPESICARKPASISHAHAAAIPLAALTAWQALFEAAQLSPGQKVLIHAGAGGVGSFAIQFAKAKGVQVAATASAGNLDLLKQLGAAQPIDYAATRFEDVVREADAVIDPLGGEVRERSWKALKKGGILVSLTGPPPSAEAAAAHGVRQALIWVHSDQAQLGEIAVLVDAGQVRPVIDSIVPLREAARAHERSATLHARGKIVLQVV